MVIEQFDFELPKHLIAQSPIFKRDQSRLLVLDKKTGTIEHTYFYNIINYLNRGDVLVLNNSKVIPARLYGTKIETGAKIEILLIKEISKDKWECLVKPAKRIKVGSEIKCGDKLKLKCISKEKTLIFELIYKGILLEILNEIGEMPLPPYIIDKLNDRNRYQTVYAKHSGSAAAPTAGLHFTGDLLDKIKKKGVKVVSITLHVGLGTFLPVQTININDHIMHSEYFLMDKKTAFILNQAKKNKNKIIAVGTTTVRTLETIIMKYNKFHECSGETNIFIKPGFKFQAIDNLITNFHLPKSTLLILISTLANYELIMKAYNEAIKKEYRFFSFGDSMLIR